MYESEVDAAKAHDRAARFHFAENAVCNFDSEREADRQALLHKERLLLQQQQLADDNTLHHPQLHGGNFSVGREEFDDLEEYHRGLDEASSEEGEGADEGEESFEPCTPRTSRSFSTSSSASTGSLSDDYPSQGELSTPPVQQQFEVNRHRPVAAAAVMTAATNCGGTVGACLQSESTVPPVAGNLCGPGAIGSGTGRDAAVGSGSGGGEGDFSPVSTLFQDLEPTPLEGMGFPYAEDLLGYEMQSFYSCQDDERSAVGQLESLVQPSYLSGRPADLGEGFGDLGQLGRQGSSSSMSSGSFSSDDNLFPCTLPPLLGMCADP